jgi:hypothetical protein
MKRNGKPGYQYFNSLKNMLKKSLENGFMIKNLDVDLRRLLYFAALKKHCYVENIVELALREYLSKDKTISPFLECDFEIDFAESFNIRKKDFTAGPKNEMRNEG